MRLIGIHESFQGSEILSIRINECILGPSQKSNNFGLGPDDIVVLQKCEYKTQNTKQKPVINIVEKKKNKIASMLLQRKPKILSLSSQKKLINFLSSKIDLFNEEEDGSNINDNLPPKQVAPYKLYVHSPGGLLLYSQASFAAYFSQLLHMISISQSKRSTFSFNKLLRFSKPNLLNNEMKYNFVSEGYYYSWNIFSEKDVIVTVDNPGGCTAIMINKNGEFEDEVTTEDWTGVSLSSKLRFFRCSQPILAFLMDSHPIFAVCYYIYDAPIMSNEDFDFCMTHFTSQNDSFEFSIAMALIVNCDLKFLLDFLSKYDRQHPRIIFHLINNVSPSSKLCSLLIPILKLHMLYFNDDIDVAIIFFEIAMCNNRADICKSLLLPLIKSSLWSSSKVAICTALFFIKNDMINEALECINIATILDVDLSKQKKQIKNHEITKYPTNPFPTYENLDDLVENKNEKISLQKQSSKKWFSFFDSNHNRKISKIGLQSILDLDLKVDSDVEVEEELPVIKPRFFSNASPLNKMQKSRSSSLILDNQSENSLFKNKQEILSNESQTEKNLKLLENEPPKKSPLKNLIKLNKNHEEEDVKDVNWTDYNLNDNSSDSTLEEEEIEDESNSKINLIEAYEYLSNEMTSPDDSDEYGPSKSSKLLLTAHYSSIKTKITSALTEIISRIGTQSFETYTNEVLNKREVLNGEISNKKDTNQLNPLDALINSNNADNEIDSIDDEIITHNNSPNLIETHDNEKEKRKIVKNRINNHERVNIDLSNTNLYDPGIETTFEDFLKISDEIIDSIPVSNYFIESIRKTKNDYEENMMFLSLQKDITTSTQHEILFRSLVMKDTTLMEAILNSFNEENKATGTDKLILLKGFTLNITSHLETILTLPLEPLTVIEKNALAFMEPFAIGVHRLNNTDI